MFGILNINKPAGCTSRDVVNRVQRLVRPAKVGHAGTLDPLATGVLIVAVGPATRLIQYCHRLPKSYRATFLLGRRSASDDVESEIELLDDVPEPNQAEVEAALPSFMGAIQQVPPAFAAVKVGGQRAYKLARRGEKVELTPRVVTIHSLRIVRYDYPEIVLDVECSSGTYIRSLGRDLAERLGTAAVMSELERTANGSLQLATAVHLEQLEDSLEEVLLSPRHLVETLECVELDQEEIQALHHGREIAMQPERMPAGRTEQATDAEEVVGLDQGGRIVAILREASPGRLKPVCNFPQSS